MKPSSRSSLQRLLPPYPGLKFHFERLLLRGLRYRLLFASLIIMTVAVVGGILLLAFDSNSGDLGDSVWWAFLRLTDPGYLGDDEGYVGRALSTIITVLGYVLFLGLLIAILTQWMNQVIDKMEAGLTPVILNDHILILGWTHRTPYIVKELLLTRGRADRFLDSRGASDLRVVILADLTEQNTILPQLQLALGGLWSDRSVILRHGSALKLEDLERVSYDKAAAVILPGPDFGADSPGTADAEALKTLYAIYRHASKADISIPLMVVGLYVSGRQAIAQKAYGADIEIVMPEELLSQILAQCVLEPGLWDVYAELFSMNVGNTVYITENEQPGGKQFGELQRMFGQAVLIGQIPANGGPPLLCPGSKHKVISEDRLVFIAKSFADCKVRNSKVQTIDGDWPPSVGKAASESCEERRILILGWSRKAPGLLDALIKQGDGKVALHNVGLSPIQKREADLRSRATFIDIDHVKFTEANFLLPHVLESLRPWEYDNIVILARERLGDEAFADAATMTASLTLEHILEDHEQKPRIILEIVEEENAGLLEGKGYDIVLSPLIISYMLSQVALKRELNSVFTELAGVGGAQICLRSPEDSLFQSTYPDMLQACNQANKEIILGIVRSSDHNRRIIYSTPDVCDLQPGDKLIVLSTSASRA